MSRKERAVSLEPSADLLYVMDDVWTRANAYLLWSMAQECGGKQGRGAVMVVFDSDYHTKHELGFYYVTKDQVAQGCGEVFGMEKILEAVQGYDPQRQMVVVVATPARLSMRVMEENKD